MSTIEKQGGYIKFLRRVMKDPDIAEKFQCVAKAELANLLQKESHSKKDHYEALVLLGEIIKSKNSRYIDRQFAKKNYKKLSASIG